VSTGVCQRIATRLLQDASLTQLTLSSDHSVIPKPTVALVRVANFNLLAVFILYTSEFLFGVANETTLCELKNKFDFI
jgi:hypothetical protein